MNWLFNHNLREPAMNYVSSGRMNKEFAIETDFGSIAGQIKPKTTKISLLDV